jgi:TPR repeat protein
VNKVQPVYPPLARQAKIEGTVRLHAILGVDGQVIILELISGHPLLVQAAMDAVRQWKYGLVLLDGKPVEVDTTVDIIFSLEDTGGSSAQDEASAARAFTDSTLKMFDAGECSKLYDLFDKSSIPLTRDQWAQACPAALKRRGSVINRGSPSQTRSTAGYRFVFTTQRAEGKLVEDVVVTRRDADWKLVSFWVTPNLQDTSKAVSAAQQSSAPIAGLANSAGPFQQNADQDDALVKQLKDCEYESSCDGLRKSAEEGNAIAQFNLANHYERGSQAIPQDYTQAVKWYFKAAEQGYARAQLGLGSLYWGGRGVALDRTQAVAWYRRAAEQGDADAEQLLGTLYYMGQGVPKDHVQAAAWYGKAAGQGNASAQLALGDLYMNGDGIAQDASRAAGWYRKSADQGSLVAKERLQKFQTLNAGSGSGSSASNGSPARGYPPPVSHIQQMTGTNHQLSQNELWSKYPPAPSNQHITFSNPKGNRHVTVSYVLLDKEPSLRLDGLGSGRGFHLNYRALFITLTRIVVWDTDKNRLLLADRREDVKCEVSEKFITLSDAKQTISFHPISTEEAFPLDSPGLKTFLDGALNDLPAAFVMVGVQQPQPNGAIGARQQAMQETPEEAESDRQSKIQELQGEIESAQTQAQDDDERAAQMRQQAAQAANQGGGAGAIAAGIGYAGAAKFQNDAQKVRQKIADLTRQIQQLQRESVMAAREQATRQAAASQEQVARQEAAARNAPEPNSARVSDSNQGVNQQAAREQAEQAESDRQSKIQQLQAEIESEQKLARMNDENAADLQRQQAAEANQRGGAAAGMIAQVGIDKFHRDAETARQQINNLTRQIRELQGESTAAAREQASLPDSTNSSADSIASALTKSTSSQGSGTYTGPNADWVHRLLERVGSWSCPSSPTAQDGAPPQVQTSDASMRDQYVKSAVLQAWAAECYAHQERDNEAQAQALAMMGSIQAAQSLCSNASVIAGGPVPATMSILGCNESQPNSSSSGTSRPTPTPLPTDGCAKVMNVVFQSTAELTRLVFDVIDNCQVSVKLGVFVYENRGDACLHGIVFDLTPGVKQSGVMSTPINHLEYHSVAFRTDQEKTPDPLVPNACSNPFTIPIG